MSGKFVDYWKVWENKIMNLQNFNYSKTLIFQLIQQKY